MRAVQLFALAIGLMIAIGVAVSRMRSDPNRPPIVRVRTPDGSIVEMPVVRSNSGVLDPRIGGYLRSAIVYEERDRPANTRLYILRVGGEGIRMTAINSKTEIQCDVFMGDSATWAFGYAYDRGAPRCGKVR
jgi:hypothetical protein